MMYEVIGDPYRHDATLLYECDRYDHALEWLTRYTRWGDWGGYGMISIVRTGDIGDRPYIVLSSYSDGTYDIA